MSNNEEKEEISQAINNFLGHLDKHRPEEKLFLLAGLVELLRHTKSATDIFSMAQLFVTMPYINFPGVPFSFTKTLLSDKYRQLVKKAGVPDESVPEVLQMSLLLFLEELNNSAPDVPDEARLQELVSGMAELMAGSVRSEPTPENPKLPVVSPEVFNAQLVRRVFEPSKFTPELADKLKLDVVIYRGTMADGKLGPAIRGVLFRDAGAQRVLLETGEYVLVPDEYEHLVISTAATDYKSFHPGLLLTLTALAEEFKSMWLTDQTSVELLQAGSLGKLTKQHFSVVVESADLKPLEHVFDTGREAVRMGVTGATGPVGAMVRFPVPATDMAVIIEAQQDTYGPYSTSRLVQTGPDGKDVVLMRHETPRHYSLRGVYLFPLQDCLVSLTSIV
jgi:hypothetical protein